MGLPLALARSGCAGLVALLVAGCAVRMPTAPLDVHLEHAVPAGAPADAPTLGVGRFDDLRPARSRRGARAPLHLTWHGVARRGEGQTGDAQFGGGVAEGARRDAAATLARTGAFAEVALIDDGGGADLLLVAELEELVGYQYQDSGLSLFRPGFVGHRVSDPLGVARVRYALYAGDGQAVWEDRIESRRWLPGGDAARAALDALAVTNERMAHALFRSLRRAPRARALPVAVLDACGLGRKSAERMVADASEILEREAGLALIPEVRTWTLVPRPEDAEDVLRAARQVPPPEQGIALALVAIPRPLLASLSAPRFGMARPLGRHAVVGCGPEVPVRPGTIVHEIAHLFGAVHVRERSSIMHPVAEFDGRFLDLLNRRILRLTRERPLDRPLPPELARDLHELYAGAPPALVDRDDRDAALSALSPIAAPRRP